ncbi:hypothetical protein [Streptomyces sp. SID1121]|uniref:hypothetical protein n=1 Tax=Streptomyces sp. SID1121 TaxID=3425888 RepID=UPI004056C752
MKILKSASMALASLALAAGGILVTSGTAHATYSGCLDQYAVLGGFPGSPQAENACGFGAHGNMQQCKNQFSIVQRNWPDSTRASLCSEAAKKP